MAAPKFVQIAAVMSEHGSQTLFALDEHGQAWENFWSPGRDKWVGWQQIPPEVKE